MKYIINDITVEEMSALHEVNIEVESKNKYLDSEDVDNITEVLTAYHSLLESGIISKVPEVHKEISVMVNGHEVMVDERCADMVDFFNNKLDMNTEFSCQGKGGAGHDFFILFDEEVCEDDIASIFSHMSQEAKASGLMGRFLFWCRPCLVDGKIVIKKNWKYQVDNPDWADIDLEKFKEAFNGR